MLKPEFRKYLDPVSGLGVTQWTGSAARDNHLYFTSHSVTADDRWLVFLSERFGGVNLFAIDRGDGAIRQLTRQRHGILRSYCWPAGGLYGISKASPVLDERHGRAFYIQDDQLWVVGLGDAGPREPERIWDLPVGWWSAFNHVSPDGRTVCVPLAHPRAFPEGLSGQVPQLYTVPHIMKHAGLCTQIHLVDVKSGRSEVAATVPFWVTHVQFDPAGSGRIIFNCEGVRLDNRPRTWCLETDGTYRPLYEQPENESDNHENFSPDGEMIIYHGTRDGVPLIAARKWDGTLVFEAMLAGEEIHHVTPTLGGKGLVTDGGENVTLYELAGDRVLRKRVLCQHLTRHDPSSNQDDHPHPLTVPSGRSVVFSSNREGVSNVYEVEMGEG